MTAFTCPICRSPVQLLDQERHDEGSVTICPGCIAVVGLTEREWVALNEAELIGLADHRPDVYDSLEKDRVEMARRWAKHGGEPTIFAEVAAEMYRTRGADSMRLPRRES